MARAVVMDEASAFPASAASEKRPNLCRKFPIFDCPGLLLLARLGYREEQWIGHVQAVRSDFSRAMGAVESMIDKASEIGQRWLRGIATARRLARA